MLKRSEKTQVIDELREKINSSPNLYITDASSLTVAKINELRALCFKAGVEMKVVKNTLAIKAMEQDQEERGYTPLYDALKGPTTILFSEIGNVPAKIIKEFRGPKGERPILKAAYIDSDIFIGDDQLELLASLKSKEELIGDVISLLQSPAKNVISALKSGGSTIAGIVKTLQERGE